MKRGIRTTMKLGRKNKENSETQGKKSISIKGKLIISFIAILLIPTLMVGFMSFKNAKDEIKKQIQLSSEKNVMLLDKFLYSKIEPKLFDAAYFTEALNRDSYSEKELQNTIAKFKQYKYLHEESLNVYMGTDSGEMLLFPKQELPQGFDPRERAWYKDALASNGKAIITNPYVDAATGDLLVTVAQAVSDGSGVFGIDISLNELKEITDGISIGERGYPAILGTDRSYIVHPTQKPGDKAEGDWVSKVYANQKGHLSYIYKGIDKEMEFYTNELTGWKIIGSMDLTEVDEAAQPILYATLMIVAIFIFIGVLLSYFIVRSITRPLKELGDITDRVANGDLTRSFEVKKYDEIGKLGTSFNNMILALKELIQQVGEKSDLLASSSEQLNASSEQNNHATEQVANSIQEVASGTENQRNMVHQSTEVVKEMSDSIDKIMRNAQEVADTAKDANIVVAEGEQSIQKSVHQMKNINETVADLGQVIHTLGTRSNEISQIVDVISEIAGQTNLLALNAAIEAARAGEHGKGFAVVADEVRKLAEQSAKSTESIRQLIASIQADTNTAVVSMDKGTEEVEKGIQIVDLAGVSFRQIQQFVDNVSAQIHEVSASMEEMGQGAKQVVEFVSRIEEITASVNAESQEVSAATEEQLASMQEIAASAASLSYMAEELQESVRKFEI
ncbi:methyl-accepting chemotaxis protein [Heyndrickxia sp. MSNUG]|uniref:methyl-accepting chemotaxis protein n=1 Tax=Heyndrickxia sp. MSNUG TaxID=3136677 RepID=UPI003C2B7E52